MKDFLLILLLILVLLILITFIKNKKENMECSEYNNARDCEKDIVNNTIKQCSWDGEDNLCRNYTIN